MSKWTLADNLHFVRDLSPDSIGPHGKLLLYALLARAGKAGICYPSYRVLQRDTGLSKHALTHAARALDDAGLIQRQRRWRRSTLYSINFQAFSTAYPQAIWRAPAFDATETLN